MIRYLSSILSSALGNILEWYDFGLFSIFSAVFSQLFFPTAAPATALIATFGIFAVGFICRPIGALLFGYLGDKKGRAKTLRLSVLMISMPTLLIGCLPTYNQVGLMAPILLMLIRIWQGISIGGEYSGNIIYLAETAPKSYRATFTAFASSGANIGVLFAAIVGIITTTVISKSTLLTWGWRLPYLLSGVLSLFIYRFRLRIHESIVFEHLQHTHQIVENPIKVALKKNYLQIFRVLGLVCVGTTFYYFCFVYLPLYLTQVLKFSLATVSWIMTIAIASMTILAPCAGLLCDKIGRRRMLLFNALFIGCIVIGGFYYLQFASYAWLIAIMAIFTCASSLEQGVTSVAVVENFPPPARYTGVSLGYNLGNGLLGGTVPIISEWLLNRSHSTLAPASYVAACAFITFLVVLFFVPETRDGSLATIKVHR